MRETSRVKAWQRSSLLAVAFLSLAVGCSSAPPEKSDDDIEKERQQHINTMQREAQDG